MSDYETERTGPSGSPVHQLGTALRKLLSGIWDMRMLSIIHPPEKLPSSYHSKLYALVRTDVVVNKKRFWPSLCDNDLTLSISVKGRGRNDQIRSTLALQGVSVLMDSPVEKPSVMDRVFNQDKVREYNDQKEDQDMGL